MRPVGRQETAAFRAKSEMRFRSKPAGVVIGAIGEGTLNLPEDCARAAAVAGGPFKFTLTSPYMLARTLLDTHYHDMSRLTLAIADALAAQARDLVCDCVQVDEANIPGNPADAPLAAAAINRVLDAVTRDQGRAFLLRQLRRADDPGRHLAGARRVPERAARRSPGPRAGAPAAVGSRGARGPARRHRRRHRGHRHQGQPRRDRGRDRRGHRSRRARARRRPRPLRASGLRILDAQASVADRKIAALVAGRDLFLGR